MENNRNEHLAGKISGEIGENGNSFTPADTQKEDDRNQHFADKLAGLVDERGNPIEQPTTTDADEKRKIMLAGIEVEDSKEDLTHLGGKEEVSAEEVAEQQAIAEELGDPVGNEIGNLTKEEVKGEKAPEEPKKKKR